MNKEIKNFGTANGWKETPVEIKNCTHKLEQKRLGNCCHEYICYECGYRYQIDSSD